MTEVPLCICVWCQKGVLKERGYIYKGKHSGWYSVSDEAFYTESQVCTKVDEKTGEEIKVSIETGSSVEWTEEENYKFALSSFKTQLRDHFRAHPDGKLLAISCNRDYSNSNQQ